MYKNMSLHYCNHLLNMALHNDTKILAMAHLVLTLNLYIFSHRIRCEFLPQVLPAKGTKKQAHKILNANRS